MLPIVVDTNVVIAALRSGEGASRQVIRGCLTGSYEPLFGLALLTEYKHAAYGTLSVPQDAAVTLIEALASAGRWVSIYYLWRPNLRDESDNHLFELAVAGGAAAIVTPTSEICEAGSCYFRQCVFLRRRRY